MNQGNKSVGKYISILYRLGQSYVTNQMKSYDIGSGQYIFLMTLYRHDGMSQEQLSHCLAIDKGTTARAIDKLERAGYVTRKVNAKDRRAYNVFITDKARDVKPIFHKVLCSWTDTLVEELNEQEREMAYVVFEKMVNSSMRYMKENAQHHI